MAEKSTFGIDGSFLKSIDFELAGKRIISDLRSDFILAPHISCIYYDSFDLLKEEARSKSKCNIFHGRMLHA